MISIGITKQNILREINGNAIHGYMIAKNLNLKTSTVYIHLKDLEREGFIESKKEDDRVLYRLTEKGNLLVKALFKNFSDGQ